MEGQGINERDYVYMQPPPAYDDVTNGQRTAARTVPKENYSTCGNTTATLSIPTKVVGIVNGMKGNVMEKIQCSTGTSIQLFGNETNSTTTEIRINGSSEGVADAEEYIIGLLKTARQLQEYESENIDSEFLPKIASWGKAKIIQFFKDTTVFFEIRDDVLFLQGFSEEDVDNAEKKMYEMLTHTQGNTSLELKIPTSQGGIIVGHQYTLVKKLMEQTWAKIELIPLGFETTIRITGSPPCVADAAVEVIRRIQISNKLLEKVCDSAQPVVAMVNKWTSPEFVNFYVQFGSFLRCSGTTLILRAFSSGDSERAEVYLRGLANEFYNGVSERKSTSVLEIYVPDSLIGLIIGKAGANVIRMQEATGAKVSIPKERDGSGQTRVTLEGSEEGILAAKTEIDQLNSWAQQKELLYTLPENEKLIRIPSSLSGLIVGSGRKTINFMIEKSGAEIELKLDDDPETTIIRISGDPANIAEAERRIYHKLKWIPELKQLPCYSIPAAALSEWRLAEIVEFFSRTGCFLEVTSTDVEIKGFDIDEMLSAEEQLQEMVEDAFQNHDNDTASDKTANDLGRLIIDQHESSRNSTLALREVLDDSNLESTLPATGPKLSATPPELNKPKLDCKDIALLVNPMLESWSSDQLIVFQRETCTTINFDYSSLSLEGLCMEDLYATKNELFERARRARAEASS